MTMTTKKTTDAAAASFQWRQVLERDTTADGIFYYAVKSTGIVCRPSCPSRRPARSNVLFFPTLKDALDAGYRTCLRCGPEVIAQRTNKQRQLVARVTRYLEKHTDQWQSMEAIASAVGVDRLSLMRAFQNVLGVSPAQYARAQRLQRFKNTMRSNDMNVTEAIYDAGFGSSSRLYEKGNAKLGMTPRELQRGAAGIEVNYATADSPLGRMLVAATAKGVCSISFGQNDHELVASLKNQFPRATLSREKEATGWLAQAIQFIAGHLEEHPLAARFPLDVRATSFQHRVWQALREIPRGETITYSELAVKLGSPRAVRAVAGACAANPIAIVVPCHRVIGKDGSLTGYRWGTERKRRLLEAESLSSSTAKRLQ